MLRVAFLNVTKTLPCEIGTTLYKKENKKKCLSAVLNVRMRVLMKDKLYRDELKIRLQLQRVYQSKKQREMLLHDCGLKFI